MHTTGIKHMLMFYHNRFQSSVLLGTTTLLIQAVVLVYTSTCNYTNSHLPTSFTAMALSDSCFASFLSGKWVTWLNFHFPKFQKLLKYFLAIWVSFFMNILPLKFVLALLGDLLFQMWDLWD